MLGAVYDFIKTLFRPTKFYPYCSALTAPTHSGSELCPEAVILMVINYSSSDPGYVIYGFDDYKQSRPLNVGVPAWI